MPDRPTTLERAFQIAQAGEQTSLTGLLRQLKDEGYPDARSQLDGFAIRNQLKAIFLRHRS